MIAHDQAAALHSWLSAGAPGAGSLREFCRETGRRARATVDTVDQFAVYTTTIHPEIPGQYCYWAPGQGARLISFSGAQLATSVWVGCPAQICSERGRVINHVLENTPEFENRPETQLFLRLGFKQVVYVPLLSQYTLIVNAAAFATRSGFSDDEIRAFRLLQGPVARIIETFVLYRGTRQILSTYLGRDAGARVLQGNIRRGDVDSIPAVILFLDLRGYTEMSNRLPPQQVVDRLNAFFDAAGSVVEDKGGEILKFLGDGVLAIFPTPDDLSAQTAAAMTAATCLRDIRAALDAGHFPELGFRAALDIGDVHYGNIGSAHRMDFTAIGPIVNRAARLLSMAGQLEADNVCSHDFHEVLPGRATKLGNHAMKGFDTPQPVYRLEL